MIHPFSHQDRQSQYPSSAPGLSRLPQTSHQQAISKTVDALQDEETALSLQPSTRPSQTYHSKSLWGNQPLEYLDSIDQTGLEEVGNQFYDWISSQDLMQSDTWGSMAQFVPKLGRFTHQRESSLSSLGSAGPASPFNQNSSNPHIAVNSDSRSDGLPDMQAHDHQGNAYYQLAKGMAPFHAYQNFDQPFPEMSYPVTMPEPQGGHGNRIRTADRGNMLHSSNFANGSHRSHPPSVTSSIAEDSATSHHEEADSNRRRTAAVVVNNPPRLDRTMTDIYGDELYNPNFTITSSSPSNPSLTASPSKVNDVFSQRLNAANSQHLSVAQSPTSSTSRDKSPFLNGSPHAPSSSNGSDLLTSTRDAMQAQQLSTAKRMREQNREALLQQRQMSKTDEPETPKTISPKDAMLEFSETDGDANFSLFPQDSSNFEMEQLTKSMVQPISAADVEQSMSNQAGGNSGQLSFLPSQLPTGIQVPQQYPFIARHQPSHDTPPRLSSAGSSSGDSGPNTPLPREKPQGSSAEGGTYTCTYHGCTLRFETPTLLQKHKREGHRASQNLGNPKPQDLSHGMTSSLVNSQAGPHRCDRINPSTGKPCRTVFSRPYDLTRHEDTIHNARKQKVHCNLCTEEKTFSRADALTRHYRVCHPDVELPGKHRRRGRV